MQSDVSSRALSSDAIVFSPPVAPRSIAVRIATHAARNGAATAIVDGARRVSYQALEVRSERLAGALLKAGVNRGDCVALLLERSAEFPIAALAVLKAGGAYLPLDSSIPADRLAFILADAGAVLLIRDKKLAGDISPASCKVLDLELLESLADSDLPSADLTLDVEEDSLAYIIYTSGSTGRPKGVEITHANLLNLIDWHQSAFQVTSDDRASQVAGLGFDAAGWEIWPHLTAGAELHIADELTRRSPQALRDWLVAQRITISFVPTVLAEQLLNSVWPPDTHLRIMLTGADTLHRRPAAGLPFTLVNNYGPTECTVVATSGVVQSDVSSDDATHGPPSIGRPIADTVALILDDAMHAVPRGEAGELFLGGALVGRGYRNSPEMTAERFLTYRSPSGEAFRVYRTGDRAKLLPNGEIAFLGRLDDQVKIRGYRIELGEIAASLDRFTGIEASAVVARPSAAHDEGPTLVAYVVPAPGTRLAAPDLREFLAARLPDYMIPEQFVSLAVLPVTPNGKLDKKALPAPAADNLLPGGAPAVAPSAQAQDTPGAGVDTALEPKIAALVSDLLKQSAVGRDDNFFLLGGHSMLGVQLVARIRDTFGVKLSLRQLFSAPTIAGLSSEVARLKQSGSSTMSAAR